MLKGSCHVKVLRVLRTTPNCLGNVVIGGIKEAGKCFAYIRRRGIIYIIVAHFKGLCTIGETEDRSRAVLGLY